MEILEFRSIKRISGKKMEFTPFSFLQKSFRQKLRRKKYFEEAEYNKIKISLFQYIQEELFPI